MSRPSGAATGRRPQVHRHGSRGVTGTRVTFKPDPEMFKDTTVYDFDTLEKRLREESFLTPVSRSP